MTRLIERWFPCDEVTEHSGGRGWGSGFAEKSLFTWFASRPLAQAKAAVICSLLPWPDTETAQEDLKQLVRDAMTGYDAANDRLRAELAKHYPNGARMCDPFSGRAMIPLEAARLGVQAWGIDYSPVATLAGLLLADYPMRDWDSEPPLPFDGYGTPNAGEMVADTTEQRLLRDVRFVLNLVGERYTAVMDVFYPIVDGKRPWGYVWAITLPCSNCDRRFPLTGTLELRRPNPKKNDPGQSYRIITDPEAGTFTVEVHDGPPTAQQTLLKTPGRRGKTGVCSFCGHAHDLDILKRMMRDGLKGDTLMVVADIDDEVGKRYRPPTSTDLVPLAAVEDTLGAEPGFGPGLPAVPHERIDPSLSGLIGPAGYGYRSWGDLCNSRQTLGFVHLARIIDTAYQELLEGGVSADYAAALTGYAAANLVRRLKYSTRSATLQIPEQAVGHIFFNDSGVGHSFDYFETGCGTGPGTWPSFSAQTIRYLGRQLDRMTGTPAVVQRGSAMRLPLPDGSLAAVVTDPPYDDMINYCDSSDLMYVWLKRALATADPWFGATTDPDGLQGKTDEAVIKRGKAAMDHRTEAHYKNCITEAFIQARRKTAADGVVSIVFGHGDPDAWARVLTAINDAGLVLTGSWPASTEKGGKQTGEHIDNTIMMACRAADTNRQPGDVRRVDEKIRARIAELVPRWQADGLADSDQRMAAIAPAMEIAGQYSYVHDFTGAEVPIEHFMGLAHKAVEEAANVRVDRFVLKDFDIRTRFALAWARQHGRRTAAASEARWQRLSYDIDDADAAGLLVKHKGGTRFAYGTEADRFIDLRDDSPAIDIALAVAAEGREMHAIADVLSHLGRDSDEMLWSAMAELPRLVGEADRDGQVWTWAVRNRNQITTRAGTIRDERHETALAQAAQPTMF